MSEIEKRVIKGFNVDKATEDQLNDLLALVCAKFSQIPQVKTNEVLSDTTNLMVAGDVYEITIRKVK